MPTHPLEPVLLSDESPFGIVLKPPGEAEVRIAGDVTTQVDRAMAALNRHNPWVVVKGSKTSVESFPRMSVREALNNAVCHRDYGLPDDIEVVVDDDYITITSPGEATEDGRPRNPWLVQAVRSRMSRVPVYHGITAINRGYSRSLFLPSLGSYDGNYVVVLPRIRSVTPHYQSKMARVEEYLSSKDGGATRVELSDMLGYPESYIRRVLIKLEEDGVIMHMGAGRNVRYYLCRRRRDRPSQP